MNDDYVYAPDDEPADRGDVASVHDDFGAYGLGELARGLLGEPPITLGDVRRANGLLGELLDPRVSLALGGTTERLAAAEAMALEHIGRYPLSRARQQRAEELRDDDEGGEAA